MSAYGALPGQGAPEKNTAEGLLHGTPHPGGAQERRAARGGDRSLTGLGPTPVAVAFRGPVGLVRREGPREGPGADASLNYRQGADRGLDHRRHELSKEGQALGGRRSAVLGTARQAGQLPGRSVPVARERRCELPDRLQALPAEGLGRRSGPPEKAGVPEEVTFRTK